MGDPVDVSGAPFPPSPQFLPPVAPARVTAAPVLTACSLRAAGRIAEVALWTIAGTVFSGPLTPSAYQTTAQLTALGAWLGAGAAALAAIFVRRLTSRQERASLLARQSVLQGRPPFPG